MNNTPPTNDPADDLEAMYHRTAAQDSSRPSTKARQAIFEHAAQIAMNRSKVSVAHTMADTTLTPRTAARARGTFAQPKWRRPVFVGSLAAAVVAALMVGPQFLHVGAPVPNVTPDVVSKLADQKPSKSSDLEEVTVTVQNKSAPAADILPIAAPPSKVRVRPSQAAGSSATSVAANSNRPESQASAAAAASQAPAAAPALAEEVVTVTGARIRRAPDPVLNMPLAPRSSLAAQDSSAPDRGTNAPGPIDARDDEGRTALMRAVLQGRLDAVVTLLGRGADPNAVDTAGVTPLQAARAGSDPQIVDALLHAGAH